MSIYEFFPIFQRKFILITQKTYTKLKNYKKLRNG